MRLGIMLPMQITKTIKSSTKCNYSNKVICGKHTTSSPFQDDYNTIEAIMRQVQQLHIDWRPDLYKMGEVVFPLEMYMNAVQKETFIVAELDDKVVGFLYYEIVHIENDNQVSRDVIFIDSMGVDEQYRGNGVGHQLFDYVKRIKQEKRIDKIELQVNSKNINAREMYQKYGFKEKAVTMELE